MICLVQTIETKIFQLPQLTIIIPTTKLHVMNWPLTNHFTGTSLIALSSYCMHIYFYYILFFHYTDPLFECWLADKSTFFRKCTNFYISFHIIYMSLITHIPCFLYSFLTRQPTNNYLSQINLSNIAPNPPKVLRGAAKNCIIKWRSKLQQFHHQPFTVLLVISIVKYLTFGKNSDNSEEKGLKRMHH